MNPVNPNPSNQGSVAPPKDDEPQHAAQNGPPAGPQSPRKNYLELRLRIRYWWLWTVLGVVIVVYPVAVIYTSFSMQFYETHGPHAKYQKLWEDTGCIAILKEQAKTDRLDDWEVKHRWKHLLTLDDSYLALNNQAILDEPLCLGAKVRLLTQKAGPWRYDIVDSKTQTIVATITKGK